MGLSSGHCALDTPRPLNDFEHCAFGTDFQGHSRYGALISAAPILPARPIR